MSESKKCGESLEEHEVFSFIGYDEEYCEDCYYELLGEDEEKIILDLMRIVMEFVIIVEKVVFITNVRAIKKSLEVVLRKIKGNQSKLA